MTDFVINVYDRELMRKFALLRGVSEARFDRAWAEFDANRREVNRAYVQLMLAQIAKRSRVRA